VIGFIRLDNLFREYSKQLSDKEEYTQSEQYREEYLLPYTITEECSQLLHIPITLISSLVVEPTVLLDKFEKIKFLLTNHQCGKLSPLL
jgi:hypothetical protein